MRNRSLDGFRALAVLLVLADHYGIFPDGWIGVDLFFVLSGYLITGILRRARHDQVFWKPFYIKRATRILPALLLIIIASSLTPQRRTFSEDILYLLSFGDVLAAVLASNGPLGPLWSLAVEEHFYFVWPSCLRRANRPTLIRGLLAVIVLSPFLRMACTPLGWKIIYVLTPFRLDGICLGCLLALLMESSAPALWLKKLSAYGMGASVGGLLLFKGLLGATGGANKATGGAAYNGLTYTLIALFAFSLLTFLVTHPESVLARIFSIGPLVWIGSVSYGVYVYQSLIHDWIFGSLHLSRAASTGFGISLNFAAAAVSFYLIERPINRWGHRKATEARKATELGTRQEALEPARIDQPV